MTKRAVGVTEVSREIYKQYGLTLIDLPPIDWYVKGPRGGLYEAVGARTRDVKEDWDGRMYVIDKSDGLRYLRPGTRRHREAKEQA